MLRLAIRRPSSTFTAPSATIVKPKVLVTSRTLKITRTFAFQQRNISYIPPITQFNFLNFKCGVQKSKNFLLFSSIGSKNFTTSSSSSSEPKAENIENGSNANQISNSSEKTSGSVAQDIQKEVKADTQIEDVSEETSVSKKSKRGRKSDDDDDDDDGGDDIQIPPTNVNGPPDYHLAYGNRLGSVPKCRGCNMKFIERGQLRVQVTGTYAPKTAPRVAKVNFCINTACIEKGIYTDLRRRDKVVIYPVFDGRILIPTSMKEKVNPSKPLFSMELLG